MMTDQQLLIEGVFQIFNGDRDRGLCDMQLARSFSNAFCLYDGDKIPELFKCKATHSVTSVFYGYPEALLRFLLSSAANAVPHHVQLACVPFIQKYRPPVFLAATDRDAQKKKLHQ
jgi:hypothetical protein